MQKLETGFVMAIIVCFLLKILHLAGSNYLLIVLLSSMSMIYLVGGSFIFFDKLFKQQNTALSVISGIVFSVAPIGILFKIMHWPGGQNMLLLASITTALALGAIILFQRSGKPELTDYYRRMVIRAASITAVSIFFLLSSPFPKKHPGPDSFFTRDSSAMKANSPNNPEPTNTDSANK